MPRYRSSRPQFSKAEYDAQRELFYRLPARWGEPGEHSPLARLREAGGLGAVSILPILGQYAAAKFADEVAMPKEKLARLAGVSPGALTRAARALSDLGFARARVDRFHGIRLTKWSVLPPIAARLRRGIPESSKQDLEEDGEDGEVFYFASSLIYGGNWRRLSGAQHAVYLATATRARTYKSPPDKIELLRWSVPKSVSRDDLEAAYRAGAAVPGKGRALHATQQRWLRLAEVSYSEIKRITGLSLSAVKCAVRGLKHPDAWPAVKNDPEALHYAPLRVYPTNGGSLIYHFRDHVDHWPFDEPLATTAETSPGLTDERGWMVYEE